MLLSFVEHHRGVMDPITLQALTYARTIANSMGVPSQAVVISNGTDTLTERLRQYGVSHVYVIQHSRLLDYEPEAWAKSIVQLIRSKRCQIVLAPSTDRGNELLARIAAMTESPMAANCLQLD